MPGAAARTTTAAQAGPTTPAAFSATTTAANLPAWPVRQGRNNQWPPAGVRSLQYLLNAHRTRLDVDGIFGPRTDAAIRAFQQTHGLTVDGILGAKTDSWVRGFQSGATCIVRQSARPRASSTDQVGAVCLIWSVGDSGRGEYRNGVQRNPKQHRGAVHVTDALERSATGESARGVSGMCVRTTYRDQRHADFLRRTSFIRCPVQQRVRASSPNQVLQHHNAFPARDTRACPEDLERRDRIDRAWCIPVMT